MSNRERPRIHHFLQVYKLDDDPTVFIGVGPEKIAIEDPTPEMERFISSLDGSMSIYELKAEFKDAEEWLDTLDELGVISEAKAPVGIDAWIAERWDRQISHLKLYERPGWSAEKAQEKLWNSRVVIVGTGAGGTTLLRFLNAVGIGTLEAVEFDRFSFDNLATHTTLDEEDVGELKLDALEKHLKRQNSRLNFIGHKRRIESPEDLANVIRGADFFCPAFDRPRGKAVYWANQASLMTGVPVGSIGVTDFGARCGPISVPGQTPCLECVGISEQKFLMRSERAALMGTMVATLAGIMTQEIVKHITGAAPSRLLGTSLYINTKELSFNFDTFDFRPDCSCSKLRA